MTLQDELQEIKELLKENNNKVVEKKFKFPFGKKVNLGQRKKNYITILLLQENGSYSFKKYQIEDQTVIHDLIPRLATAGHCMFDKKGNPLIILPNWSVEPFSHFQHFKESLENGSNKNAYKLLLAKMKQEAVTPKKQMARVLPWILGLGLGAIVIYAFLASGG